MTTPVLDLDTLVFAKGTHETRGAELCVMEAVAWVACEPHSDAPVCVSPVIATFCRTWNDALPEPPRTKLLKPLLPLLIGTNTGAADDETRAWMATDWLARVQAPAWLRLAGLTEHAQALESLARIADGLTAGQAQPTLDAARSAAGSAARSAAWSAAGSAAGSAAWSAARSAAWSAAGSALAPTVEALQTSAIDLLKAMCAVGRQEKTP